MIEPHTNKWKSIFAEVELIKISYCEHRVKSKNYKITRVL